ncbi:MAG: hypothetical protein QOD74_488, partial [Variibacter sp.]|nr:hypothetical protein [Variibacter sp.]
MFRSRRAGSCGCIIALSFVMTTDCVLAQFRQQATLSGTNGSRLGASVGVSGNGDTMVAGAPALNSSAGGFSVFRRDSGIWFETSSGVVGSGAVGVAAQGGAVAISADGNTIASGGTGDNSAAGATWVFTRTNNGWAQQGGKLVGSGGLGASKQGWAVALSADGNTLLIGGPQDAVSTGAVWVFTRAGAVWTEQAKLVPSDISGGYFGTSVAISADGNTVVGGAPHDDNQHGGAWVFVRNGSAWSQQGGKLLGTGVDQLFSEQGESVAISADGNTVLSGGTQDNNANGATWVFIRSGGAWTQQGNKLFGTGMLGAARQGSAVALSGNGDIALIGGRNDNQQVGATWVFTRTNRVWSQRGSKLVGTQALAGTEQGYSVSLAQDGSTAAIGSFFTAAGGPARAWMFFRPGAHDFGRDNWSDIVWRDNAGNVAWWGMWGRSVLQSAGLGNVPTSWAIVGQRDFDGDGKSDLLWRNAGTGETAIWFMSDNTVLSAAPIANVPSPWSVAGTADLNGDAIGDLLWRDAAGNLAVWLLNGASVTASVALGNVPTTWSIASH